MSDVPKAEQIDFLEGKIIDAFATLKSREEMASVWRGGTDETWRAVGCTKSKAARLKESQTHDRITVKIRHEIKMLNAVLDTVNPGTPDSNSSMSGTEP